MRWTKEDIAILNRWVRISMRMRSRKSTHSLKGHRMISLTIKSKQISSILRIRLTRRWSNIEACSIVSSCTEAGASYFWFSPRNLSFASSCSVRNSKMQTVWCFSYCTMSMPSLPSMATKRVNKKLNSWFRMSSELWLTKLNKNSYKIS